MISPIRSLTLRAARQSARLPACAQCLRGISTTGFAHLSGSNSALRPASRRPASAKTTTWRPVPNPRFYSQKTTADEIIEEIQEQYATARDEFEIASEETEKHSVYAADDRAAARDELKKLLEIFAKALDGEDAVEVRKRVGQRIRELEGAMEELNRADFEE